VRFTEKEKDVLRRAEQEMLRWIKDLPDGSAWEHGFAEGRRALLAELYARGA
jgi:hypothetical protein